MNENWKAKAGSITANGELYNWVVVSEDRLVADIVRREDAHLIAAAPDMYSELKDILSYLDLDATTRYENAADEFYVDTGLMAPGKDASMAMGHSSYEERRSAWDAWNKVKFEARLKRVRAALEKAEGRDNEDM